MHDAGRFKLLYGPYRMPRCRLGGTLRCAVRGDVLVKGISDAPIPWPMTRLKRGRLLHVLCGGLIEAICCESEQAVAYHWGVSVSTVWKWRKALGVDATTEGTSRLRREWFSEPWALEVRAKAHARTSDPERNAKIAAAKRGMPRPRHVIDAMVAGRTGKPHSEEARQKMREAHKRRRAGAQA